ncbi:hypothetical protein Patl1_25702 [Pistacia atlantica]|uniref:Uncharacterized protein n=1 Tax=Pistacia atlantica TaxID=434234 RepID=A0ACC1B1N8_9ROSI|nr:hypothetical protein Patl1_25702 [Pistacia atlantica]
MFQSLSIRVSSSSSPVKERQDVFPPSVPRIQKTHALNAVTVTPTISTSKGTEKNDRKGDEKDRSNIRPSSSTSVLRPRAVLSSPGQENFIVTSLIILWMTFVKWVAGNNDAMIGNKNKIGANQSRVLRNHNFNQHRYVNAQCKVTPSTKSQTHTKLSNDAADKKSGLKGKKGSVTTAVATQRRSLRSGKSSSVKT